MASLGFRISGLDGFVGAKHCPECLVEGQISNLCGNGQADHVNKNERNAKNDCEK